MSNQGPNSFKIDQAATFQMVMAMDIAPKLKFGSDSDQECLKDGTPKWVAQVTAGFRTFGAPKFAVLPVTIASHEDPSQGIQPGTPVELVGLEVGVMDKKIRDRETKEEKVVGAQVYYRAEGIRPVGATSHKRSGGEQAA